MPQVSTRDSEPEPQTSMHFFGPSKVGGLQVAPVRLYVEPRWVASARQSSSVGQGATVGRETSLTVTQKLEQSWQEGGGGGGAGLGGEGGGGGGALGMGQHFRSSEKSAIG